MIWFLLIIAVFGYLFYRLDKKFKAKFNDDRAPKDWDLPVVSESPAEIKPPAIISYSKNTALFSPAERSFFGVVNDAVADNFTIFAKVRVADAVSVQSMADRSAWQIAFNKISSKHFDFVLCDKGDLSLLGVIELDDKSHQRNDRIERDQLLENVCQSAQLPLIRFDVKNSYAVQVVRAKILHTLGVVEKVPLQSNEAVLDITQVEKQQQDSDDASELLIIKSCPKCTSIMIKRKAKTGPQAGKLFWACSTYPACRGVRPIDEE